jgi:RNA polymerase sigma factor (sigma-70 family)
MARFASGEELATAPEPRLVAAAREGDQLAFRELWRRAERAAYGVCLHVTGNRDDALDALADAQLASWRGLDRYSGAATFGVWVYAIARNAALGVARKRAKRTEMLLDEAAGVSDSRTAFDEVVGDLVDVRRALEQLPGSHREALLLWAGGLTYEQAAQELDVPVETLKSWILRGRRKLREVMGSESMAAHRAPDAGPSSAR